MGKPSQSSDRSCSGALSRRIAHRVSMHVPLHNGVHFDAVVPKMAKQTLAFPASLRTRFLNWKEAPAAYYNHPNNHPRDRCTGPKDLVHEAPCQPFCKGECGSGLTCFPLLPCPNNWNCCGQDGKRSWWCLLCAAGKCRGQPPGWRCRKL